MATTPRITTIAAIPPAVTAVPVPLLVEFVVGDRVGNGVGGGETVGGRVADEQGGDEQLHSTESWKAPESRLNPST